MVKGHYLLQGLITRLDSLDKDMKNIDSKGLKLAQEIKDMAGDDIPLKRSLDDVSRRYSTIKDSLVKNEADLQQRKDVLVNIVRVVNDANKWVFNATESLGEMVVSKPDLAESKMQIVVLEVRFDSSGAKKVQHPTPPCNTPPTTLWKS